MKRLLLLTILLVLILSLPACSMIQDITTKSSGLLSCNKESNISNPTCYSPYEAPKYVGMDFSQVESLFHEAGFERITLVPINDINTTSSIADGAVESVTINGLREYAPSTKFDKDGEVIITYHIIPRISLPILQADAISKHYMDVGKMLFEAGFTNIETDEMYDLLAGEDQKTIISLNGQEIGNLTELPFDGRISVIGHFPVTEHAITINIDFESNWIFSKYNVDVTLASTMLGSLQHGENGSFKVKLSPGSYDLVFSKEKDSKVAGRVTLDVNSDTTITYQISCNRKTVEVKTKDYISAVPENSIMIPFSSWHYLRKDYQTVVEELKSLGFTHVVAKATSDSFWVPDNVNTVVGIAAQGNPKIEHDDVLDKSGEIVVYYHVADFMFAQDSYNVTEKDSFNLPYSLTSGDTIDSIIFEIDNSDVLQRNEDGTYTALKPGTATVTASSGGHIYSKCKVDVAEIIIPIEKLVFPSSEIIASVGSTFTLDYTIIPENANYKQMSIIISNTLIEPGENDTFYSSKAGDSEISFYQDDRLIGSCEVHATYVEIEELTLGEAADDIFIGDTLDLAFKLFPENATNKDIRVTCSDTRIADVEFDERGASSVKIIGKAVGKATITIKTPNGKAYKHTISVKEVMPTELAFLTTRSMQRIEVGMPINLEVNWKPENTSVKELTWTSSNNKVIKVDKNGNLEAVGVGTAEVTAKHKSGISAKITIIVEPTLVTSINVTTNRDETNAFYIGNTFSISTNVFPENATDKSVTYSSSNESVAKVSNKGIVTAVGVGTAAITVTSPDGPKQTVAVTVSQSPQKFKITWSARMTSNDHVGNRWSKEFYVNDNRFNSGNVITLSPGSSFKVYFYVEESDTYPDTGTYYEVIKYSDDLCKNGRTIKTSVYVTENRGRYSGCSAIWDLTITIKPVK